MQVHRERRGRSPVHPSRTVLIYDLSVIQPQLVLTPPLPSSTRSLSPSCLSPSEYLSTSTHPMRETVVLGLSWFLVYTSFQAIQNLQSSLHEGGTLGTTSLACVYTGVFISSFLTPAIIYNTGVKAAIMLAWVGHCCYLLCNFFPHWATLVPGSILMGILNCPLWTCLEVYITTLAKVEVTSDPKRCTTFHASFSRLNGAFFSIFMASHLSGNLISSTILFQSNYNATNNAATQVEADAARLESAACGAAYCARAGRGRHIVRPDPHVVSLMLVVFLLFEVAGLLVTKKWLPDLQQRRLVGQSGWHKVRSHLSTLKQPRMWLLVPFLVSRMMNLALEVGTFTEAFISCTLGIRMVGYVMAARGLATMVSAGLLGWLARFTGRQVLCLLALVSDLALFLVLTWWEPRADQLPVFLGLAALMGLVEGVWAVQVNALVALMFPAAPDSAFAMKGMWSSLSMAITFITATFLCPLARIHMTVAMIIMAAMGYIVLEVVDLRLQRCEDERHTT